MTFIIRSLYKFVDKLWINHRPLEEGILLKLTLLWRNSSIIALSAVAVSILYSSFITNIYEIESLSAPELAAIGILFAVLNTVYRVATYGHINRGDESSVNEDVVETRKKTFQRSYFSFIFSLLIFAYLGIGITILSDAHTPKSIIEVASLGSAFNYTILVVATTLFLSIISEIMLWIGPFRIPSILIDELN